MKKCKYCQTEIDKKAKICPNCKKRQGMPIWLRIIIVILILGAFGAIAGSNTDTNDNTTSKTTTEKTTKKDSPKYELDKAFTFDNLEITIGSKIEFTSVDNEFSEHNGKSVVKMPITVKNMSDDTHSLNMFEFKIFGSQGTELENVSAYFDESIDFAGELQPEASYTKSLYFLYDGNGDYTIEFDNYSDKIKIKFNITK